MTTTASGEMRKVEELAKAYDKTLRADDRRFAGAVKLVDEDGSVVFYEYAFLLSYRSKPGTWIMVFTEHHGFHVFDENSLLLYAQYGSRLPVDTFPAEKEDAK